MEHPYLITAGCILIHILIWFVIGLVKKNNGLMDIAWGLGFMILAIVNFIYFKNFTLPSLIMLSMIIIWAIRLSTYLFIRNWSKPEDWRYAKWRSEWKYVNLRAFFQVYFLQGSIMFLMSFPIVHTIGIQYFTGSIPQTNFSIWNIVLGVVLFLIGFYFEAVGDQQLFNFKKNPANKGKVMNKGLWKYTRHPNYFGEFVMWWGIFFVALSGARWSISIISPVLISFLLLKVSGVAMLERKYSDNPEYAAYQKRTSTFFPRPPREIS